MIPRTLSNVRILNENVTYPSNMLVVTNANQVVRQQVLDRLGVFIQKGYIGCVFKAGTTGPDQIYTIGWHPIREILSKYRENVDYQAGNTYFNG